MGQSECQQRTMDGGGDDGGTGDGDETAKSRKSLVGELQKLARDGCVAFKNRSPSRRSPLTPLDAAALHPYYISPDLREPTTPANSVVSDDDHCHCIVMDKIYG